MSSCISSEAQILNAAILAIWALGVINERCHWLLARALVRLARCALGRQPGRRKPASLCVLLVDRAFNRGAVPCPHVLCVSRADDLGTRSVGTNKISVARPQGQLAVGVPGCNDLRGQGPRPRPAP